MVKTQAILVHSNPGSLCVAQHVSTSCDRSRCVRTPGRACALATDPLAVDVAEPDQGPGFLEHECYYQPSGSPELERSSQRAHGRGEGRPEGPRGSRAGRGCRRHGHGRAPREVCQRGAQHRALNRCGRPTASAALPRLTRARGVVPDHTVHTFSAALSYEYNFLSK